MERLQILCFAGTYGLALLCDLARVVYRGPARWWAFVALCVLGLAVHTIYLGYHASVEGRWAIQTVYESLLLVAWLLSVVNLYLVLRVSRQAVVGLFFLPMIVILCGLAVQAPRANWADWGGVDDLLGRGPRALPARGIGGGGDGLRGGDDVPDPRNRA
jgi:hypothetical protein